MNFELKPYSPDFKKDWDEFVASARNSSFLFFRDYMDYHADRFRDCSWMAFKGSRLVALLPANLDEQMILHSHQGLTYGGWILPPHHLDGADLLEIFQLACSHWLSLGIQGIDYKPLPYIYASSPSQEDLYALFRLGFVTTEVNLSMAIDLNRLHRIASQKDISFEEAVTANYNKLRRRALSKASPLDFQIYETSDATPLLEMVTDCLRDRHNATPVHTLAELQLLRDRFPHNIRFHLLSYLGAPQAAVCIFDSKEIAHCQYIATTPLGRELNLLTPLFHYLISKEYASRAFFDFGTSNEDHGQRLNASLLRQKASYGAGAVTYPRLLLPL